MTEGLRKQIERANALVPNKVKMEVALKYPSEIMDKEKFDLMKLNEHLFKCKQKQHMK